VPLLLVLLLLLAIFSLRAQISAAGWVEHSDDVRLATSHLLRTLLDAETAERGYLITLNPQFLEPYERAGETWPAEL
jgi:CHASE3 domain sensor protein